MFPKLVEVDVMVWIINGGDCVLLGLLAGLQVPEQFTIGCGPQLDPLGAQGLPDLIVRIAGISHFLLFKLCPIMDDIKHKTCVGKFKIGL